MKFLIYATYPTQTNGYSKVASRFANYLSQFDTIQVYYFGITNFNPSIQRFVHPRIQLIDVLKESPSKDPYGMDLISYKLQIIKPDIIFLYNDILVLTRIFNALKGTPKTFQVYTYIDLVYEFENSANISYISSNTDKFFVFSECWRNNLAEMGITKNVYLLEHGLNDDIIYPVDKQEARKALGLNPNDFIILNTNRNTHRKGIDITITAFLIFLKKNNFDINIKLFLNMDFQCKTSYDIESLVRTESQRLHMDYMIVWNHIYRFSQGGSAPDHIVNLLYNATDVGINTCYGEGFGLCNFEHGCMGRAQIMTKTGALIDIFKGLPCKQITPVTSINVPLSLDSHGGIWDIGSPVDFAKALQYYYENTTVCENDGKILMQELPKRYNWNNILKTFYQSHILNFENIILTQSEIKPIL